MTVEINLRRESIAVMAEGGMSPQKDTPAPSKVNLVCRYFIHGVCTKGSDCRYIHDRSGSVPSDNICKFYLSNKCTYGENCRYQHVKREESRRSTQPVKSISNSTSVQSQPRERLRVSSDSRQSQMVTLSKKGLDHSIEQSQKKKAQDLKWAQAKAFVPGQKYNGACPSSYAAAIGGNDSDVTPQRASQEYASWNERESESSSELYNLTSHSVATKTGGLPLALATADTPLCPFFANDIPFCDETCKHLHGDICDMCGMPKLHPLNAQKKEEHTRECLERHEREMKEAFALQASEKKECEICLENVLQQKSRRQTNTDRRFGILENCNHCFCLSCIKKWRGNKDSSIEMQKFCPTCRTHSDFVTPSKYWVETSEEKAKLIKDYKEMLKSKPCRFFKKGKGECPFDRKCFYLHALADGTVVERNQVKRRRRTNAEGRQEVMDENSNLWSFINRRNMNFDRNEFLSDLLDDVVEDVISNVNELTRNGFRCHCWSCTQNLALDVENALSTLEVFPPR
ncbi:hypothetical protein RRG08_015689 [Elysia crispata]|uniref:RING-type E3 ubiquitin transferase n=1 Tax=Elysia crispata TaxID=231223 RepID=A0AAE0Y3J2_9GAST|nr:hypothetical protein RRG08_015689 [Elysia crispata]